VRDEVCLTRIKEKVGEKRSTVCTHRYADCLLKNTSTKHNKYVVRIYSIEIEIKDTSDTNRSASYLNLHLEIDSEGRLRTKSTVCTHRHADCLLKNTSTKHNKYVVNQKHEQVLAGSTGKDDSDLPKAVQVSTVRVG
jgi:nitrite reductase/ring-hydroxylating ferredoxin subunit